MIREFSFKDPFPKDINILTTDVELPHQEIAQFCKESLKDSFDDAYTSYFNNDLNNHKLNQRMPYWEDLKKCIKAGAVMFLENQGVAHNKYADMVHAWWSVYREYDFHTFHNHPKCCVAGTYYPYADEQSCPLVFKSPLYTIAGMSEPSPDRCAGWLHRVKPKTGMMLFWNPWLEHQIGPQGPQTGEFERTAISFNFGRV